MATQMRPATSTVSPSGAMPGSPISTIVRGRPMSPVAPSKSNASMQPVPLSAR
jgi:hypothetical protein